MQRGADGERRQQGTGWNLQENAADDANGRVIYLSSFSKTLAPGFRVAWVAAPAPIAVSGGDATKNFQVDPVKLTIT